MTLPAVIASDTGLDAGGAEKRPGAYRTISEVSDDLALPQHVLRFWEGRFAQIRPLKRAGGRRYYRPDDIDLLRGIRCLLQERGHTIKGAQRVLRENGVRFVQAIGRGEAEAGTPPIRERVAATAGPESDANEGGDDVAARDALLRDVLRELLACREAITRLRPGAPEES